MQEIVWKVNPSLIIETGIARATESDIRNKATDGGVVTALLLHLFRELGLKGTEMAKAQCGTIRLKLLKIGAQVKVSVRRIVVAFAVGYPYQRIFAQVYENLLRVSPILRRAGPVLS